MGPQQFFSIFSFKCFYFNLFLLIILVRKKYIPKNCGFDFQLKQSSLLMTALQLQSLFGLTGLSRHITARSSNKSKKWGPKEAYGQNFTQSKCVDTDREINKEYPNEYFLVELGGWVSLLRLGEHNMCQKKAKCRRENLRFFVFWTHPTKTNGIKIGSFDDHHVRKPKDMLVEVQGYTGQEI